MKILILEYITGGGMRRESIPPALAREGRQMRDALALDLLAVAGVELALPHDNRLAPPPTDPRIEQIAIAANTPFNALWLNAIRRCDATWPIAPETGGLLERLCRDVEQAGKRLLNCPSAAVRVAASKLATARRLAECGLPAAHTVPLLEWKPTPNRPFVIKPDDGAGCEGARFIDDPARFDPPKDAEHWVAQDLLDGDSLSLSALFADGKARLLSCNRQQIKRHGGGFTLQGCRVNAVADTDGRWQALTDAVARAMPMLWGYAGIDLILTAQGPVILEINPRLTTSYAGLRQATSENPAALTLALAQTGQLPPRRAYAGMAVDIVLEQSLGH